jgi:hypothetical protein
MNRRKLIMHMFNTTPDAAYCVNASHRPQMKDDPDLQYLVKKGKLKLNRSGGIMHRTTYLTKV